MASGVLWELLRGLGGTARLPGRPPGTRTHHDRHAAREPLAGGGAGPPASGPRVPLAYAAVAAPPAVLAVTAGRRTRPGGLPFAHATPAAVLAVTFHGGATLPLTQVASRATLDLGGVLLAGSISVLPAVGRAARVPTARRGTPAAGRRSHHSPPFAAFLPLLLGLYYGGRCSISPGPAARSAAAGHHGFILKKGV